MRDGDDPDARPRFVQLAAPTDADVAAVLDVIRVRVIAMRKKKGRLDDDDDDDDDEPPEPHLQMAMHPTRGPRSGASVDQPLPLL